jgi:hypothetical protein
MKKLFNTSFTGERVGNDIATLTGTIVRGVIHVRWSDHSGHIGTFIGNIINVAK